MMYIDDGRLPEEQPGVMFDMSHGVRMAASSFEEDWWSNSSVTFEEVPTDPESQAAMILGDKFAVAALQLAAAETRPGMSLQKRLEVTNAAMLAPGFAQRVLDSGLVEL